MLLIVHCQQFLFAVIFKGIFKNILDKICSLVHYVLIRYLPNLRTNLNHTL